MDAVTTQDILKKLNIKVRTLRRWQELQLIPTPTVQSHPEGRGRLATWPAWVVDRCLEIRKLTNEQKTLQEVAELLGPPKPPRRKYSFKEASERRERELLLFRITETLGKTLRKFSRESLEWMDFKLLTQDQLENAMRLVEDGHRPVLVVTQEGCEVGSAVDASHYFSERTDCAVITVIPLTELIADVLQKQRDQLFPIEECDI